MSENEDDMKRLAQTLDNLAKNMVEGPWTVNATATEKLMASITGYGGRSVALIGAIDPDQANDTAFFIEKCQRHLPTILAALRLRSPAPHNCGIDWRPIETAPKDGTTFITYSPPFLEGEDPDIDTAGYIIAEDEFWKCGCGFQYVTHWTPMVRPDAGDRP